MNGSRVVVGLGIAVTLLVVTSVATVAVSGGAVPGLFTRPEAPTSHARIPPADAPTEAPPSGEQKATFGCGCFWCAEALFQRLKGVRAVVPGYSGGPAKDSSYEQVSSGDTGHAEVVQVAYDPAVISYGELLEVFWQTHDPTTKNRQGNDVGPQYRSVIFYHTDEQKALAEHYKKKLDESGAFPAPIVTEIVPFKGFYPAEAYHQNYFNNHPQQPYCAMVIGRKVEEFERVFKNKLKSSAPGEPGKRP